MISDGVLKDQFVTRILERDQKFILKTQKEVIKNNLNKVTGDLEECITNHEIKIHAYGKTKKVVEFKYLKYLRFLDIKSNRDKTNITLRRNLALYNRVIWGRIYNETIRDIRTGYKREIEEQIYRGLVDGQNN